MTAAAGAWEVVVGVETHAQLLTRSKMFSGASGAFGVAPNTQASAVDIALPGTLPVANRAAVEHAIRFGLAVKGAINRRSIFARKNYFYPDLPKGYQISQYETPVVQGGTIEFFVGDVKHTVNLTRAHLEEDAQGMSCARGEAPRRVLDNDHRQEVGRDLQVRLAHVTGRSAAAQRDRLAADHRGLPAGLGDHDGHRCRDRSGLRGR